MPPPKTRRATPPKVRRPKPAKVVRPHPPERPKHAGPPARAETVDAVSTSKRGDDVDELLEQEKSILDLVDNLLNRGVVLNAELIIGVAGVDLVYLRLSALLAAADRVLPQSRATNARAREDHARMMGDVRGLLPPFNPPRG